MVVLIKGYLSSLDWAVGLQLTKRCCPLQSTMTKNMCFYERKRIISCISPFSFSLTGRSTCGCNSSRNRSLRLLNCDSDHHGVFIVHYIKLIWDSCCVGNHMNLIAWAINQWSCWFRGFPLETSSVFSLAPTGSSFIWQKDTSRCRHRLPEFTLILLGGSYFICVLIYHIYNPHRVDP